MTVQRTTYDLDIIKDRDFSRNIYLRDANNDAVDLTGWTGIAQIREAMSPESVLIANIVVTIANAALGKINLYIAQANTKVCQATGVWDLALTNAADLTDTYVYGNITFSLVPSTGA